MPGPNKTMGKGPAGTPAPGGGAKQGPGIAPKDLKFDDDYEDQLDDLERLTHQYLALENKLYRVAKKMVDTGKKLRKSADDHIGTIQEAADGQDAKGKAALTKMITEVNASLDDLKTSVEDAEQSAKREVTIMRKLVRALK